MEDCLILLTYDTVALWWMLFLVIFTTRHGGFTELHGEIVNSTSTYYFFSKLLEVSNVNQNSFRGAACSDPTRPIPMSAAK